VLEPSVLEPSVLEPFVLEPSVSHIEAAAITPPKLFRGQVSGRCRLAKRRAIVQWLTRGGRSSGLETVCETRHYQSRP